MALVWMHCTLKSNDSELYGGRQGQTRHEWKNTSCENVQTQQINVNGKVQNTPKKHKPTIKSLREMCSFTE